jgi:hypothetical protein
VFDRGSSANTYNVRVVALHADTAAARTIDLPPGCVDRMLGCSNAKSMSELMLVMSRGGAVLSLFMAEREVISVWTLEEEAAAAERWSRQVGIARVAIDRSVEARRLYQTVFFEGFGVKKRHRADEDRQRRARAARRSNEEGDRCAGQRRR